jgi:hypothetical protein
MILTIDNIDIDIQDFVNNNVENGAVFITDALIHESDFDEFLNIYHKYVDGRDFFVATFEGIDYTMRFGQFLYNKNPEDGYYKIRLVFVDKEAHDAFENEDPRTFTSQVVTRDLRYLNLCKTVVKQQAIINKLYDYLAKQGFDIEDVFNPSEDQINAEESKLLHKSDNLSKYLKDKRNTIVDIKEEIANN